METNEKRFEFSDKSGDAGEKVIITQSRMLPDGTCQHKVDWKHLTPEQQAKMTLSLINNLTKLAFDRLDKVNGSTNISLLG